MTFTASRLLSSPLQGALSVLITLAQTPGLVPMATLARCKSVHTHRVDRLLSPLIGAGVIVAQRGRSGGYTLGRSAQRIRLSEVARLMHPAGPRTGSGVGRLAGVIDDWLAGHTLADLLQQPA